LYIIYVMGHILDKVIPLATTAAGYYFGGPLGAAAGAGLGSGGVNYSQTHNIGSALKSGALNAAGTYAGGQIASNILPNSPSIGSVIGAGNSADAIGPYFNSTVGSELGGQAGGMAGNLLSSSLAGVAGGAIGGNIANSFAPKGKPSNAGNYPYVPSQQSAAAVPASISGMSGLTSNQQSTGLANQGTYGGGLGPQENSYFLNLENRKLVNPNGSTNDLSTLQPIESSYLSKLGLGGYTDPTSLLKAISQWKSA
jgi:hypothetical protein